MKKIDKFYKLKIIKPFFINYDLNKKKGGRLWIVIYLLIFFIGIIIFPFESRGDFFIFSYKKIKHFDVFLIQFIAFYIFMRLIYPIIFFNLFIKIQKCYYTILGYINEKEYNYKTNYMFINIFILISFIIFMICGIIGSINYYLK